MTSPDFQLFTSLRYDPLLTIISQNTSQWPSSPSNSSPFYMLPHHRDRMLEAALHFGWETAANTISGPAGFSHLLQKLTEAIDINSSIALRVQTILDHDGEITIETNPTPVVGEWNLFPQRLPPPATAENSTSISSLTGGALSIGDGENIYGDASKGSYAWDVLIDPEPTKASGYTSYKTTNRDMYSSARERVGISNLADEKEVLLIGESGEVMEGSMTTSYFWRGGRWVTPPTGSGGQIGTTRRWALGRGLCVEEVVKRGDLRNGEECWISSGVRGFRWGKVRLV